MDLRDRSGVLQVVFTPMASKDAHELAESIRSEWVIRASGEIRERKEDAENPNLATGAVELMVNELEVLAKSDTPPFEVEDDTSAGEELRLRYRFVDLRRPFMQRMIRLRHDVTRIIWDVLSEDDFIHVETPILLKSTPEGARDYIVPSRIHHGKFYALPQSPQQLKQILMVSGIERYFQIARCFRDEDLRADRQPEHTQLDLEMSFVHQEDVMNTVERLYTHLAKTVRLDGVVATPFVKLTYKEAIERYGTDKPDLRIGMELIDVSDEASQTESKVLLEAIDKGGVVKAFAVPRCGDYTRKQCDELIQRAKDLGAPGLIWIALTKGDCDTIEALSHESVRSPLARFMDLSIVKKIAEKTGAHPGDLILAAAGDRDVSNSVLGKLRMELGEIAVNPNPSEFKFVWVTDFPLFEWDEDVKRWAPSHHVFSAPQEKYIDSLEEAPGGVIGNLFDLVCNGWELGSGSIRIHDTELQKRVFGIIGYGEQEVEERFGHLLKSFRYGVPPHGGMGLGLDRIVAILGGVQNIREVIAFPKTQTASDLMFDAPSAVTEEQLRELHVNISK